VPQSTKCRGTLHRASRGRMILAQDRARTQNDLLCFPLLWSSGSACSASGAGPQLSLISDPCLRMACVCASGLIAPRQLCEAPKTLMARSRRPPASPPRASRIASSRAPSPVCRPGRRRASSPLSPPRISPPGGYYVPSLLTSTKSNSRNPFSAQNVLALLLRASREAGTRIVSSSSSAVRVKCSSRLIGM
jgi:hypothetical protein